MKKSPDVNHSTYANSIEPNDISSSEQEDTVPPTLEHTLDNFKDCVDLVYRTFPELHVSIVYFEHLIGNDEFTRDVIEPLTHIQQYQAQELFKRSQFRPITDSKELIKGILNGEVAIFHYANVYLVNVSKPKSRSIQQSETETIITGPHDSFIETATTNISLIRKRVKSSHLKVLKLQVGEITKNDVYILYIDGLVNMDYVKELVKRIELIEVDAVHDGNMLIQYIDDYPNSLFPLFSTTERTDAAVSKLVAGRIVGILDGSPSVFTAPSSFFEFFASNVGCLAHPFAYYGFSLWS